MYHTSSGQKYLKSTRKPSLLTGQHISPDVCPNQEWHLSHSELAMAMAGRHGAWKKSLKSDSWQQATKLREPSQHHKHAADPHSNSVSKFLMARNRTSRVNLTMRQEPAMFSNSASNSPTCNYLC